MWTWKGQLTITFAESGTQTEVTAATKIPGQLFDWGKSTKILDELLATVRERAAYFTKQDL